MVGRIKKKKKLLYFMHVLWTRVAVLVEVLQRTENYEMWRLVSAVPALGRFCVLQHTHLLEAAMDRFTREEEAELCGVDVKVWKLPNGKKHRGGDLPAVVTSSGDFEWWWGGDLRRGGDKPVIVLRNGTREWRKLIHGERVLHRDGDKPAVIYDNGSTEDSMVWYWNGFIHRGGDKPAAISAAGRAWYWMGQRHRDGDEPAVISSGGTRYWYKNGLRYREGVKPVVILANGVGRANWQ